MSYYDFEHFWSPKQVCGQKSSPQVKIKKTKRIKHKIKQFVGELLGQDWSDDKAVISRQNIQDLEDNR